MKRITKIRIPKGELCCYFIQTCFFERQNRIGRTCSFFYKALDTQNFRKCDECIDMFPNGAVFELKEKK